MSTKTKNKTRPWKKHDDPMCCIGCEQPFKYRDRIIDVGCMALHDKPECIKKYVADCKELGIKP